MNDVAGFIDLLTRSGLDITSLEAAEALWLANAARPAGLQSQVRSPPAAGPTGESAESAERGPAGREDLEEPAVHDPEETGGSEEVSGLPVHLPPEPGGGHGAGGAGGVRVPMPASTALPGSLRLLRAMRPLRLRVPAPQSAGSLDEAATAQATAASGTLLPVIRPATERRFSLTLVVDTGPAMAIWSRLEAEFLLALQRLGAFRGLRRWYLRAEGGALLGVSESTHPHAPVRDPAELRDPAGRRLILVLTDGAGSAWYSGAMAGALRGWANDGPVAILQPLPQQLWAYTALRPVRGRLLSPRGGVPNTGLGFIPRGRFPQATRPPVPVPVLEIAPRWLGGWARLVAQDAPASFDCAVTLCDPAPVPSPVPVRGQAPLTAQERVVRFAEQASPPAQRLASYLAAAPLSLPVIRHVQQAMLPGSGPSDLAEVLLGGLVTTRGVPGEASGWRYDFAPGVRDYLLRGLDRADALRVVSAVSRDLNARMGRGADEFTGIVAVPGASGSVPASRPFARISTRVLQRITGDFTDARPPQAPVPEDPAAMLIRRYQRTGALADIDAAIAALRSSQVPPPVELATALRLRYLALADPADLDEAIDILRAPRGPRTVSGIEHERALALGLRNARTGSPADLQEAISAAGAALRTLDSRDPERPLYTGTYAELLTRRGTVDDLDLAVELLKPAADSPGLPGNQRAVLLTLLAAALSARAADVAGGTERSGKRRYVRRWRQDGDDAIVALRRAVELTSADEDTTYGQQIELAARYAALGAALLDRWAMDPGPSDPAEAASAYRQAAVLVPAGAETGAYLTGLGVALRVVGQAYGDPRALGESVAALRRALGETLPDAPEQPGRLTELARALLARYKADDHRADLIEARYRAGEASECAATEADTLAARQLYQQILDLENPSR